MSPPLTRTMLGRLCACPMGLPVKAGCDIVWDQNLSSLYVVCENGLGLKGYGAALDLVADAQIWAGAMAAGLKRGRGNLQHGIHKT